MHESSERLKDLTDLIFDGRNQSFGAYLLRRLYPGIVIKACITAISGFSAIVLLAIGVETWLHQPVSVEENLVTIDPKMIEPPPIDPKTPPPPALPAQPPPPKISTVRFVPPEVTPDEEIIEEDPPKQEELKAVVSASQTVEGSPDADPNELVIDGSAGTGEIMGGEPEEEEAHLVVEEMPRFPDGDVQYFFVKHLKYTQKAILKEISGKVYISFVVNKDGSITEVTLMKGLGYGLDEEALRVVKMMPNWIPGKQGGREVKVKIVQPIVFNL
jgi:protein TonB